MINVSGVYTAREVTVTREVLDAVCIELSLAEFFAFKDWVKHVKMSRPGVTDNLYVTLQQWADTHEEDVNDAFAFGAVSIKEER
jgi:hypothetical protein